MTDEIEEPISRLGQIAERLAAGDTIETVTVRELLSWFGARRRGFYIVDEIRSALAIAGLKTQPDFDGQYIDGPINFELAAIVATVKVQEGADTLAASAHLSLPIADPTYRIGKLPAAHNAPTYVQPNEKIEKALSVMMLRDFSFIPVMTTPREVKGVISSEFICNCLAAGKPFKEARDCMTSPHIVDEGSSLFDAMDGILKHGYVLVSDHTKLIIGIITTHDLSLQFRQLTEPFLLLSEIENHIRHLIARGNFTLDELKSCSQESNDSRNIRGVSDLTFGEYIRLIESPTRWERIGVAVDRVELVKSIDNVRQTRNDVMHFEPDPLESVKLDELRAFALFFQKLHSVSN